MKETWQIRGSYKVKQTPLGLSGKEGGAVNQKKR